MKIQGYFRAKMTGLSPGQNKSGKTYALVVATLTRIDGNLMWEILGREDVKYFCPFDEVIEGVPYIRDLTEEEGEEIFPVWLPYKEGDL